MNHAQPRHVRRANTAGHILCAALAGAAAVRGGPAPETLTVMDPVQVTAARMDRPAAEAPGALDVIPADAVVGRGAVTVVDALRDLAAMPTRSISGNAAQAEIALRGFGENAQGRVLVLHDGRRLNSPEMTGIAWLQVPVGQVERIEVLRGAQSVLYGNHALAGVIQIVGREPSGPAETRLTLSGGSFASLAALASTEGHVEEVGYRVGADYHTTDGYRDRSGYEAWNLYGSLVFRPGDTSSVRLRANLGEMDYELPGNLTREQMKSDPRQSRNPDDAARLRDVGLGLDARADVAADTHFLAGASLARRALETDLPAWMSFVDSEVDTLLLTPRLVCERPFLGLHHRWLFGADVGWDRLEADRFADPSHTMRVVSARIERLALGLYALDDVMLDDALTLRFGARAERSRTRAEVRDAMDVKTVDDARRHSVAVWEAGLRYQPDERLRLFTRISSLYRYPYVDEQVSYYGYGFDRMYRDLDPETGHSAEAGAAARLGGGARLQVNLFQIEMRDEIAYNPVTGLNENLARTRRRGLETTLEWHQAGLGAAGLRYAWTHSRFTRGEFRGNAVPLVPEHRLSVNAALELPAGFSLLAVWHGVDTQRLGGDNAAQRPRLGSYATLDLGLRCVPPAQPDLMLYLGLDNVLDESYADVGYAGMMEDGYYPAAGRAWKAAVSYRF